MPLSFHALPYIVLAASVLAYFLIRGFWIIWQVDRYSLLATYWCLATKQGVLVAESMTIIWPMIYILAYFWRWDWRTFVADQDSYDQMNEWVAQQLARSDLDRAQFLRELGQPEEGQQSVEPGNN